MKKVMFVALAGCLIFASCATKKSTYEAAYEKAKEKPAATQTQTTAPEAPKRVVEEPVEVVRTTPISEPVRKEKITTVNESDAQKLKTFGIVMGSFSVKTNAESLITMLKEMGHNPFMVQNESGNFRVILESHDLKEDAAAKRDDIKTKYKTITPARFQDIWLLERVQ